MAARVLVPAAFYAQCPAYSNVPQEQVQAFYTMATAYIEPYDVCGGLSGNALDVALYWLTAHLLYSSGLIARGQTSVIVTGATVGEVTVSLDPPPTRSAWDWWLATSPYGLQLLALLRLKAAGGWSVGGRPETRGFRKVGGFF